MRQRGVTSDTTKTKGKSPSLVPTEALSIVVTRSRMAMAPSLNSARASYKQNKLKN